MTDDSRPTVHEGRWTLEHRFESPWHYLPVEVGPGTAGLRVELEYEQAGEAVLDLGCLGPRVPRLVGGCAELVRHHRGGGHAWVPAR